MPFSCVYLFPSLSDNYSNQNFIVLSLRQNLPIFLWLVQMNILTGGLVFAIVHIYSMNHHSFIHIYIDTSYFWSNPIYRLPHKSSCSSATDSVGHLYIFFITLENRSCTYYQPRFVYNRFNSFYKISSRF